MVINRFICISCTRPTFYNFFFFIKCPHRFPNYQIFCLFFVIKFALTIGFAFVLHIVGIISASLAIFNLLPVIPLDGGHLFLIGLEKLRGKVLSIKTDQFIAKAGFTLIIMLALFVFYSDFERIGLINKIREVIHV